MNMNIEFFSSPGCSKCGHGKEVLRKLTEKLGGDKVVVTAGMAITVDSIGFAVLAGFLFATLFTLPMVITSYKGVHEDAKQLLNRAAKGSPYLRAVLLLGTALYLLIPSLDIDISLCH